MERATDPEALREGARGHMKANRWADAVSCWDRYLIERPADGDGWVDKAACLCAIGRHQRALTCLARALENEPDHVRALVKAGEVLRKLKRSDEARRALERARAIEPHNATVLLALGALFEDQGDRAAAARTYLEATHAAPKDVGPWERLGLLLHAMERHEEALVCADMVLSLEPAHFRSLMIRAQAHLAANRGIEALADLAAACESEAAGAEEWVLRARLERELGKSAAAARSARRALDLGAAGRERAEMQALSVAADPRQPGRVSSGTR